MWQLRNVKCAHVAFLLHGAHLDSLLSLPLSWLRPIVFNSTNWCPGPGAEPEQGAVATEVKGLGRGGPEYVTPLCPSDPLFQELSQGTSHGAGRREADA